MTNYDYKKIALDYALSSGYDEHINNDMISYWQQAVEEDGLDFVTNLIKKIHSIGPNFLLFEGNKAVELEFCEPDNRKINFDHTELMLNETSEEAGNYRFSQDALPKLNFDEQIIIDIEDLMSEDVVSGRMTLKRSDGNEETIEIDRSDLYDSIGEDLIGYDAVIGAYKNKDQVRAVNLDDPYFESGDDKDSEAFLLSIQYPQISSKYQGLIPLIKKFIREDLLRAESSLNPTKLIKSIEIVPWEQKSLLVCAIVSNSTYQLIIDKGDEEAKAKYIDDLQDELNKSEERLNKLLRDHCDLQTSIVLNCRTKAEQFSIVAKKRLNEIVHQIGTLKNLTNSQYYDSDDKSWQKIQRQLIDSIYDLDRYVKSSHGNSHQLTRAEAILQKLGGKPVLGDDNPDLILKDEGDDIGRS